MMLGGELLVLIPAFIAAALGGVVIVPRRHTRQLAFFGLVNAGILLWSVSYFVMLLNPVNLTEDQIIATAVAGFTLGQLGVAVTTTYWLLFALESTGDIEWTHGWRLLVLHAAGFVLVVAAITNGSHGLFATFHLQGAERSFSYGPLATPVLVMSWSLVLTSMVVYGRSWLNTSVPVRRRPFAALVFAGALPLGVNVLWTIGSFDSLGLPHNPTIWFVAVSDLVIAWAVFRGGLMDIVGEAESHAFAAMRDGAIVLGPDGAIRSMNPKARAILPHVTPGDMLDQVAPALHLELRRGAEEFEYQTDTDIYWVRFVRMTGAHEPDELGEVLLFTNMTERREAERRINELNRDLERTVVELQAATETKNRFVANLSQELRTPLQSIVGYTDVLGGGMSGPINPEQREHLMIIMDSAIHLQSLIDSLLDVSNLGEGVLELSPEPLDACELVESVVKSMRSLAEGKGLEISSACGLARRTMFSDATKLRQVLISLTGNAIKFTAEGSVVVSVASFEDHVVFRVKDTGPGIERAKLESVFEAFKQEPTSGADRPPGAGLGLYVSRTLATFLGGTLTVQSTLGEGSTFILSVPAMLPLHRLPESFD